MMALGWVRSREVVLRLLLAIGFAVAMTTAASAGMTMNFEWGPTAKCFDPKSPPITLSGVPAGTKTLAFNMVDLDAPSFKHGGGTVAFGGQKNLPYGAFSYRGPCPPRPHTYEISVRALDGSGKALGTAKARRRFP
ncbi:phospholipid-binding protein [Mesorhizobium sp. PAMC28654]|uniref:YbhB/YbcL family Raf kinase inhibitor-like protein n=1 Tax=Mesorhizobium sp. PAMC28654 TaxID=2880934 RepID=UPI001D0AFE68|nr:YbhB/YbcL family Raf kinase inhibitor-like protein [Mesorhizobium sp. PAMC28654]UDL89479.1 phospholipid-binding protein [Mesorhizobium sp. PAMC28654]